LNLSIKRDDDNDEHWCIVLVDQIDRLLSLLKQDTEINRERQLQQQLHQLTRCRGDSDAAEFDIVADGVDKNIDRDEEECASVDDNTSMDFADSGLGAPSDT
jgi:hypothetical protein